MSNNDHRFWDKVQLFSKGDVSAAREQLDSFPKTFSGHVPVTGGYSTNVEPTLSLTALPERKGDLRL